MWPKWPGHSAKNIITIYDHNSTKRLRSTHSNFQRKFDSESFCQLHLGEDPSDRRVSVGRLPWFRGTGFRLRWLTSGAKKLNCNRMPIFCCCHQWRLTISSGDKIPNWTRFTVLIGAFESFDMTKADWIQSSHELSTKFDASCRGFAKPSREIFYCLFPFYFHSEPVNLTFPACIRKLSLLSRCFYALISCIDSDNCYLRNVFIKFCKRVKQNQLHSIKNAALTCNT